jgi:hypothetical protein
MHLYSFQEPAHVSYPLLKRLQFQGQTDQLSGLSIDFCVYGIMRLRPAPIMPLYPYGV